LSVSGGDGFRVDVGQRQALAESLGKEHEAYVPWSRTDLESPVDTADAQFEEHAREVGSERQPTAMQARLVVDDEAVVGDDRLKASRVAKDGRRSLRSSRRVSVRPS
jgi:hypothetical protein